MNQRQITLWRAQAFVGLPRGKRVGQRLGIGQPDVLDREARQAAGDIAGVLAAFDHARHPVERGIGVGAPERLVKGADEVEVAFLAFVVEGHAALHRLGQGGTVEHGLRRQLEEGLRHVE